MVFDRSQVENHWSTHLSLFPALTLPHPAAPRRLNQETLLSRQFCVSFTLWWRRWLCHCAGEEYYDRQTSTCSWQWHERDFHSPLYQQAFHAAPLPTLHSATYLYNHTNLYTYYNTHKNPLVLLFFFTVANNANTDNHLYTTVKKSILRYFFYFNLFSVIVIILVIHHTTKNITLILCFFLFTVIYFL